MEGRAWGAALVRQAKRLSSPVTFWAGLIGAIVSLVGYSSQFFEWGKRWFFPFLSRNWLQIWLFALSAFVVALLLWTWRLHLRFTSGLRDNFRRTLSEKWDFRGDWKIFKPGVLEVTNSDPGGLSKSGAFWENYTFSFKAKIIRDCLGVIVRARDPDNYHMFQIRRDKLRPHLRVVVPRVRDASVGGPVYQPAAGEVGQTQTLVPEPSWLVYEDHVVPLKDLGSKWFDVKIAVSGDAVTIEIDGQTMLRESAFLRIPTGKVGFRNSGLEKAHVKNARVVLDS